MCGRFAQAESEETVMQTFGVQHSEVLLTPRYNVAPTQDVPVIMQDSGVRRLEMRRWGRTPAFHPTLFSFPPIPELVTVCLKYFSFLKIHFCLISFSFVFTSSFKRSSLSFIPPLASMDLARFSPSKCPPLFFPSGFNHNFSKYSL